MKKVDSRSKRDSVLDYITNHFGCTKTDVINYMRGHDRHGHSVKEKSPIHLSQKPTEKRLDEFTSGEDPIVISEPDKNNSQIHRLYINDKNLFIQVNQMLTRIETHIIRWNEPISKINKLINAKGSPLFAFDLKKVCIFPYYGLVGLVLRHLPNRIRNMKFSKKDADMLSNRLLEIDKEFSQQILGIENLKDELLKSKNALLNAKSQLSSDNVYRNFVDNKMYDDLMQMLQDFEKQFLN